MIGVGIDPQSASPQPFLAISQKWDKHRGALDAHFSNFPTGNGPHVQPVAGTKPTITTSNGDMLGSYPVFIQFDNTALVDQHVRIECGVPALVAGSFLRPEQASLNSSQKAKVNSRISVNVTSQAVAFYVIGSADPYRFIVDGQYVDLVGTLPAAASGTGANYIMLNFASAATRHVTIELQRGQGLRRILADGAGTFEAKPVASTKRIIIVGDSVTGGQGATHLGDGFAPVLGDLLGVSDCWASGVGGSGYLNTQGGSRFKLSERLGDVNDHGPWDLIVIAMGLNDFGLGDAKAEAGICFDLIRSSNPETPIAVVGPWDNYAPTPVGSTYSATKSAIMSAVGARPGVYFIDPEGIAYTKDDSVHPDTAGHTTLAQWLNGELRQLVQ
ncbi:SGNH/GDSL hydrolase family protein [Maritalea sp.]|uniref:SGNH/GDSL hydrolase family protein n=1 Tax=Maritalea sp. TaxID=2003361 RepID=UPI003EF63BDC